MSEAPAYTHTRRTAVARGDAVVEQVDDVLRDAGLAHVARRRTVVTGIGVLHHTWTASVDDWTRVVDLAAERDDLVSSIAVDVFAQAQRRRRDPDDGARAAADEVAVPLATVRALLESPGRTDVHGWPTVTGLAAVRSALAAALPADAVRATAAEMAALRRADPDQQHHVPLTGPSPAGACRVLVTARRALAASILLATGSGGDDHTTARLAVRLDGLAGLGATPWAPSGALHRSSLRAAALGAPAAQAGRRRRRRR